jgi:hypothetical protein
MAGERSSRFIHNISNKEIKSHKHTWALLCSAQLVTMWNVEHGVMFRRKE